MAHVDVTRPHRKPPSRLPSRLRGNLLDRLTAYGAAACAAGVGTLALPGLADAQIVYTPARVEISAGKRAPIDLNHDGITDFTLINVNTLHYQDLAVSAPGSNQVQGFLGRSYFEGYETFASDLPSGERIGGRRRFGNGSLHNVPMVTCVSGLELRNPGGAGVWGAGRGYLGLRFRIAGQTHYGWAAIEITGLGCMGYTEYLLGYAYNTVADQTILAGEKSDAVGALAARPPAPATLGLLARGAPGLSAWRRDPEDASLNS